MPPICSIEASSWKSSASSSVISLSTACSSGENIASSSAAASRFACNFAARFASCFCTASLCACCFASSFCNASGVLAKSKLVVLHHPHLERPRCRSRMPSPAPARGAPASPRRRLPRSLAETVRSACRTGAPLPPRRRPTTRWALVRRFSPRRHSLRGSESWTESERRLAAKGDKLRGSRQNSNTLTY